MKYCYSFDEERFHDEFETRQLAMDAAEELTDGPYWTAEVNHASEIILKFTPACRVFESADEFLGNFIGWDDTILEFTSEDQSDLNRLIVEFIAKRCAFNAYGVTSIMFHDKVEGKE